MPSNSNGSNAPLFWRFRFQPSKTLWHVLPWSHRLALDLSKHGCKILFWDIGQPPSEMNRQVLSSRCFSFKACIGQCVFRPPFFPTPFCCVVVTTIQNKIDAMQHCPSGFLSRHQRLDCRKCIRHIQAPQTNFKLPDLSKPESYHYFKGFSLLMVALCKPVFDHIFLPHWILFFIVRCHWQLVSCGLWCRY